MVQIDFVKLDNGTGRFHVLGELGDEFYMSFILEDTQVDNPETFLIRMANMIASLYYQRGKEFTWRLE